MSLLGVANNPYAQPAYGLGQQSQQELAYQALAYQQEALRGQYAGAQASLAERLGLTRPEPSNNVLLLLGNTGDLA